MIRGTSMDGPEQRDQDQNEGRSGDEQAGSAYHLLHEEAGNRGHGYGEEQRDDEGRQNDRHRPTPPGPRPAIRRLGARIRR